MNFEKYGRRRPVRGGVRAHNRSGKFGTSWWGRSLIDTVERLADSGRMSRGRTYARQGQVLDFTVGAGEVVAEVQGSQNDPFISRFAVEPLADEQISELAEFIRARPGMLAEIVSGSLPDELGPALLPQSASELDFLCSCPDDGYPCKHVAATVYLMAEHLDATPVAMLTLRGVNVDALIEGVERSSGTLDDPFGERLVLPGVPIVSFVPAPVDLDPELLRRAFSAITFDAREVAQAVTELNGLYQRLQ